MFALSGRDSFLGDPFFADADESLSQGKLELAPNFGFAVVKSSSLFRSVDFTKADLEDQHSCGQFGSWLPWLRFSAARVERRFRRLATW